ncbi:uncharacterized protein TM35_000431170 [Trypanosoma theileri]|uniref:Uncharacterized protein n=1 Tax=Trypanosoma theileri TaxID=67003 RepID=A0A1X0NK45_9TRYP|nr:uncharacterized protein TM35_000431170 [Trypanosoma theileri]ORC84549.1 hypothetical protein TM35_000431170 [Trypanosoma theileri]
MQTPTKRVPTALNETPLQRPVPFTNITNAAPTTVHARKGPSHLCSATIRAEPRVVLTTDVLSPPAITVTSENGSCTPREKTKAPPPPPPSNEDREPGSVDNSVYSEEHTATPEKKLQPRKFLQKYLYLKNLHVLPSTPEQKKKQQSSTQFRRPVKEVLVAAPTLSNSKCKEQKKFEDPRQGCFEESNTPGRVAIEILSSKTKNKPGTSKNLNDNIIMGRNGRRMYPERKMETECLTSSPERNCEVPQPITPKHLSQDVELPHTMEEEEGMDRIPNNFTKPNGEGNEDILKTPVLEESGNQTDIVDISAISTINDEDIVLQVGDFEPCPPFSTPLDGVLAVANARRAAIEFKKDDIYIPKEYEIMDFNKIFLEVYQHKMEEMRSGSQEGISESMVSPEEAHSRNLSDCLTDLELFLSNYYDEEFDIYKSKLLDIAFDILYTQMVAIPATRMLEYLGRRLLCMQRDIAIRGMIELFVITFPKVYTNRKHGKESSHSIRGEKGVSLLRNKEISPRSRTGRSYSTSHYRRMSAPANLKNVHKDVKDKYREKPSGQSPIGVRDSGNTATTNTTMGNRTPLNKKGKSERLSAYMVVRPVPRKRTPKPSPRDEDFLNLIDQK